MLIGAMNNPHSPILKELELFGEMNFDYAELTIEAPEAAPERLLSQKKGINELLASYNFGVLGHLPWYFSVAHPYPSIQKAIKEETGKALECAREFGIDRATIHTEFMYGVHKDHKRLVEQTIATMRDVAAEAEKLGLRLLVENFNDQSFSIADFEKLLAECGNVGMTFDIGHANMIGRNGDGIAEYMKRFSSKIEHVHCHDNFGKEDNHLPIGVGYINWEKTVRELKKFYDKTVTMETHSRDYDYLKMSRDKLEILWYGKEKFDENRKYLTPPK